MIQVADRFHLLQNVVDVLERVFKRCPRELQEAATQVALVSQPEMSIAESDPIEDAPDREAEHVQEEKPASSYRQTRFDRVKAFQVQSLTRREIARQLGMDRRTVSKYFHLEAPPQRS